MPPRKDLDAAAGVPAFYGAELRWKREAAGLTLQDLAHGNFYSIAYLSQIELGDRRMPPDFARHADRVLKTDGFFERRCEDVRKARRGGHAEYFADVAEMEKSAETIEEWAPILLPGLLQTEKYAEQLVRAAHPRASKEDVDAKVTARMARSELFRRSSAPDFWAVLDESVVRRAVLPRSEMAAQLRHLVEIVRRVQGVLQVMPKDAGAHPFMMGTARVMTFPDAPPVVYTESMFSGQLIDDHVLVRQYRRSYDRLRGAAMPTEESLALIEAVAEEYQRDYQ